jgi:hypothetical protein
MTGHLPQDAAAFMELFARLEHLLRRNGYTKKDHSRAVIDWKQFAREFDETFFKHVKRSGKAATLLREPPRIYYRGWGMQPEVQEPIRGIADLFLRGVCQVRNNIVHGEKYIDLATPRDDALVREAHWVLEQAITQHKLAKELLTNKKIQNEQGEFR